MGRPVTHKPPSVGAGARPGAGGAQLCERLRFLSRGRGSEGLPGPPNCDGWSRVTQRPGPALPLPSTLPRLPGWVLSPWRLSPSTALGWPLVMQTQGPDLAGVCCLTATDALSDKGILLLRAMTGWGGSQPKEGLDPTDFKIPPCQTTATSQMKMRLRAGQEPARGHVARS